MLLYGLSKPRAEVLWFTAADCCKMVCQLVLKTCVEKVTLVFSPACTCIELLLYVLFPACIENFAIWCETDMCLL